MRGLAVGLGLVVGAACGRLGFDTHETGSADAAIDANPLDPDGSGVTTDWLMVAGYEDPNGALEVFRLDRATGDLTETGQGPVSSQPAPSYFAASPDGRHVYIPHETAAASAVSGFAIDPATGYLTELPGSPFPGAGTTNQIAVLDPGGTALFVSGSAGIQCYRRDASGALDPTGAPTPVPGSFLMAIDPLGRFLYSATYLTGEIRGFAVDATACALTSLGAPTMVPQLGLHGIAIDPGGKFLVTLATGNNSAYVYKVDATGALSSVGFHPGGGRWVSFTRDGERVLLADGDLGLWSFAFDPVSGAMSPAPGAPYTTGARFWYVTPDPTGAYAYANDRVSLYAYDVDGQGRLVTGGATPTTVGPLAMGWITTTAP